MDHVYLVEIGSDLIGREKYIYSSHKKVAEAISMDGLKAIDLDGNVVADITKSDVFYLYRDEVLVGLVTQMVVNMHSNLQLFHKLRPYEI